MITLRLDKDMENRLQSEADLRKISRSELIRECIREHLDRKGSTGPWEMGQDLFGKYASGRQDLSANKRLHVAEKIKAKKK